MKGRADGKMIDLGCFDTALEGAVAYARHAQSVGVQPGEPSTKAQTTADA